VLNIGNVLISSL